MGFKNPKTRKGNKEPNYEDDKVERDLDPTKKVLSGGGKVAKKNNRNTSDAPKAFQHIMKFMEMKKRNDQAKQQQKQKEQTIAASAAGKKQTTVGPKAITEDLKIMPGETMGEFNKRVKNKMENNMQLIGSSFEAKAKGNSNPAKDEGDEVVVSTRSDRKKRNDAVRKQRRQAKKNKNKDSDDDEDDQAAYARRKASAAAQPRFGEQAEAPPIFKALPKQMFKKMVPMPDSKEEAHATKIKEEVAVKKMIQRTARLSPLERMQAKRKAKLEGPSGDTAAEKRIIEAEREKAIRRYRMLRVARESAKHKK
ncbi:hypothetical protein BX661DRAFT_198073 [Kickxella alabastrina]|uniref:uncharacterized protein n=1 Tax=Kickxella alabastrina TaxID=61397 RepID=UPI00221EA56F|nr:uncharacterized protein BX661DRAFT_198073 [Kickxella alabastrina]KAI7829300.1 hypothetical protein BX661DRAFT_198073 [Kickxella alabastrina]KAJ1947822.1 hypothetical protein GGF37_000199 [Kickxella alabastrina]